MELHLKIFHQNFWSVTLLNNVIYSLYCSITLMIVAQYAAIVYYVKPTNMLLLLIKFSHSSPLTRRRSARNLQSLNDLLSNNQHLLGFCGKRIWELDSVLIGKLIGKLVVKYWWKQSVRQNETQEKLIKTEFIAQKSNKFQIIAPLNLIRSSNVLSWSWNRHL